MLGERLAGFPSGVESFNPTTQPFLFSFRRADKVFHSSFSCQYRHYAKKITHFCMAFIIEMI